MSVNLLRMCIQEGNEGVPIGPFAERVGFSLQELQTKLSMANSRLQKGLKVASALELNLNRLRANGICGVLRISTEFEIEIVPKFLAKDDVGWREDFFTIASTSKYGRILPRNKVSAGRLGVGLFDILAWALYQAVEQELRKPIREYRQRIWSSFELSGDCEPEDLSLPGSDGFDQAGLQLTRANHFNRVIKNALMTLADLTRNTDLRRLLKDRAIRFGQQQRGGKELFSPRLPNRHSNWLEAVELSLLVGDGTGLDLGGELEATQVPGFALNTEKAWEALLFQALKLGFTDARVTKSSYPLGTRFKFQRNRDQSSTVNVTPDVVLEHSRRRVVIDAKYKGTSDEESVVSSADLYEALAFLRATGAYRAILLYPQTFLNHQQPGRATQIQLIKVHDLEIIGMTVAVSGIARSGGIVPFSKTLAESLSTLI